MTGDLLKVIAIIGPTASGKTSLGIQLANLLKGEIISADSMQIYQFMDIGTAKPTPEELQAAPHHLINIIFPDSPYNAGMFVDQADAVIKSIDQQNKIPIILGGTSLYVKTLIDGMIGATEAPADIKTKIQEDIREKGLEHCYAQLKSLDPESAAELHANDVSRIVRALEVFLTTGQSIKTLQKKHRFADRRYQPFFIGLDWPREVLYQRINERVKIMVEQGLVKETAGLLKKGYHKKLPALNSIGYRQAVAFIEGKMTHDEMIADIQQKTRRYAKKQMTWYRKNEEINWLEGNQLTSTMLDKIYKFIETDLTQQD
ncbi:MAG: tRNA (adenosine(37)-N6)-dimethylallyltransferase MiaA [Bacteroidetes bacterium]|nr:tRNA (adenosine(37)-N6)-dimethylallyltransferase MiaA [Bacteroidota bacterium]